MKQTIFIVADRNGISRLTKRVPFLGRGEIGVCLKVTIPDAAFTSPLIHAELDVLDEHVMQPTVTLEPIEAPREQDEDVPHPAEAPDGEAGQGQEPPSCPVGADG
jgi:hypothetical protein